MPSFNCTNGSPFSTLYVVCNYTVGSANVASNYTPVTVQLSLVHGGLNMNAGTDDCSVSLGGTTKTWTGPGVHDYGGGTVNLGSTSFNVYHNSDGTWSGTLSVSYRINITYSGTWIGTISGSRGITLPTIPRASSISTGTIVIGSGNTVSISRASSSFTHDLTLKYGSLSTSVYGAGTSATITPPMSWCNSITTTTAVTGTLTCTTKSGSSTVGTTSISVTISIPSSVKPGISASATIQSGFNGMYLQGRSKAKISISATTSYGSPIRSYSISGGGYTSSSSSYTTGTLNTSGTITFTCSCTDARGRSASTTVSIYVTAYSAPKISVVAPYRCTATGAASEDGTYAAVQATFSGTSLSGANTVSCYAYYRQAGATSWSGSTKLTSNSKAVIGGGNLTDYNEYQIRIYLYDTVGSSSEYIYEISTSGNYLFSGKLGHIGIGMRAPNSGREGVYMPKALLSNGVDIEDLRDLNITPGYFGSYTAKWYFDQTGGNSTWKAVLHIQGWTVGGYAATEIAFPASDTGTDYIYWRMGRNGSWSAWKRVLSAEEQLTWAGVNKTWVRGREGARVRTTSINGYSALASVKTTNGTWDIGAYDSSDAYDDLLFTYVTDSNYNANNNNATAQIQFREDGTISGGKWGGSAIPISNGGTGATSANAALNNLNIYFSSVVITRNGSTVQDISLSTLSGGKLSSLPVGGVVLAINGDRGATSGALLTVSKWTSSNSGQVRLVYDNSESSKARVNSIFFYV